MGRYLKKKRKKKSGQLFFAWTENRPALNFVIQRLLLIPYKKKKRERKKEKKRKRKTKEKRKEKERRNEFVYKQSKEVHILLETQTELPDLWKYKEKKEI